MDKPKKIIRYALNKFGVMVVNTQGAFCLYLDRKTAIEKLEAELEEVVKLKDQFSDALAKKFDATVMPIWNELKAKLEKLEAENNKLREAFVQAKALLKIAKCPQCDGSDEMVVFDMHPTMPVPCLWCIERKQVLEESNG